MTIRQNVRPARICIEPGHDADLNSRFCYWHGASGTAYIHSVYPADACPALPGAIYIAVARNADGGYEALDAGCLDDFHGLCPGSGTRPGCTELHVHLLAGNRTQRDRILNDLRAGLFATTAPGTPPARRKTPDARQPGNCTNGFHEAQPGLFAFGMPPSEVTRVGL